MPGTVTDISIGGCYVEMLSPLPVKTLLQLPVALGDEILQLSGEVRSAQAGFGMGVLFLDLNPHSLEKLRRFAPSGNAGSASDQLHKRPSRPAPPAIRTPESNAGAPAQDAHLLPTQAEAFGALMRILIRKGLIVLKPNCRKSSRS